MTMTQVISKIICSFSLTLILSIGHRLYCDASQQYLGNENDAGRNRRDIAQAGNLKPNFNKTHRKKVVTIFIAPSPNTRKR